MPVLFLDFDGVLHPEHSTESKHFCCLSILEDALRRVPECKVVITSTWRLEQPYENLLQRFSPDIAAMIEGVTPRYCDLTNVPNTLVGYEREAECHAWLWANTTCRIAVGWPWMIDRGCTGRFASHCFWSMAARG